MSHSSTNRDNPPDPAAECGQNPQRGQTARDLERLIDSQEIYDRLYEGVRRMNVVLAEDVVAALRAARRNESASQGGGRGGSRGGGSEGGEVPQPHSVDSASRKRQLQNRETGQRVQPLPGAACFVLDSILENADIAAREDLPMCQDTGFVLVFVEQGERVRVVGEPLDRVIHRAIGDAYRDGKFRNSVVADPLADRSNTGTNLPPAIYYEMTEGEGLTIGCLAKGFGSENYSQTRMLKPTAGAEAVVQTVVETMQRAGGNCCPPAILGVGIGGTMDWAARLSKKALLRDLSDHHPEPYYGALERQILDAVNGLGIGAGGLGGATTALAVHIETYPTHIAGLPVAVSVNCWAERKAVVRW